jgi:UDP-glucose 4-epimerase
MRVLVTGGAGFIGSHLSDAFLDAGHEVLVLDDLSSGRRENVPRGATVVQQDIRAPEVREVFSRFRPDVLCHHAAQMDVRRSVADPAFDADVNVVGTLRLLELCREHGTHRILFASTGGAIYGYQDVYPAPEEHPTRPVSPYGVAKLSVEGYLHFYTVEYGFAATCLRYANVYGPRQNPHGEAGVVAIFSQKLLAGGTPTIYGLGAQTRDFVYVGDVVQANVLALEKGLTGSYNVGTGVETSVNDLYESIRSAAGQERPAERAPARPGEQLRSCLDSSKLEKATGWRPRTSLTVGIARTVDYFRTTG